MSQTEQTAPMTPKTLLAKGAGLPSPGYPENCESTLSPFSSLSPSVPSDKPSLLSPLLEQMFNRADRKYNEKKETAKKEAEANKQATPAELSNVKSPVVQRRLRMMDSFAPSSPLRRALQSAGAASPAKGPATRTRSRHNSPAIQTRSRITSRLAQPSKVTTKRKKTTKDTSANTKKRRFGESLLGRSHTNTMRKKTNKGKKTLKKTKKKTLKGSRTTSTNKKGAVKINDENTKVNMNSLKARMKPARKGLRAPASLVDFSTYLGTKTASPIVTQPLRKSLRPPTRGLRQPRAGGKNLIYKY